MYHYQRRVIVASCAKPRRAIISSSLIVSNKYSPSANYQGLDRIVRPIGIKHSTWLAMSLRVHHSKCGNEFMLRSTDNPKSDWLQDECRTHVGNLDLYRYDPRQGPPSHRLATRGRGRGVSCTMGNGGAVSGKGQTLPL